MQKMINPTIEFVTSRLAAIHAMLTDGREMLSARQTIALVNEYDQLRIMAKSCSVDSHLLSPNNVWEWHCEQLRLPHDHTALSIPNA